MEEDWLTLREAARYMKVSVRTVYRMVLAGDNPLPHARIGKEYRFRKSEIDSHIKSVRPA